MYDHINKRGWLAIAFMAMGIMSTLLILVFFMLGERPLGLRFLQSKKRTPNKQPSGQQGMTVLQVQYLPFEVS